VAEPIEVVSDLPVAGRPMQMWNTTEISSAAITENAEVRQLASQLSRWVDNARAATSRSNMFDKGAYVPPDNPYDEMRAARHALKYDSIVSGVSEITEAIAFQGLKWESEEGDEADVFNQWSRDVNLDQVVRSMWREEFTISQTVVAKIWGWKTYTVRGKTKGGNRRKRTFRIWCPIALRTLNPARCIPVDLGPLGGDRLCWASNTEEVGYYQRAFEKQIDDPLMIAFFTGTYTPPPEDVRKLVTWNVDVNNLLMMDPEWVFRHTATKADYEPFPEPRLKSCFQLLDMKTQLMQSDRAALIGNANYILLVRKGDDKMPARPEELQNLRDNYSVIARTPVIIADHRLNIDIVAPKTDLTLQPDKYEVINNQILSRLLGTLTVGGRGQRNETQVTISEIVARVMDNRRHMLSRTIEREIAHAICQHPKNADVFTAEPSLVFTPRNISLAFDQSQIQGLLSLRASRELSRETILEYFGLDQATEAMRLEVEGEFYDDVFKTVLMPGQMPGGPTGEGKQPEEKPPPATPAKPAAQKPGPNNTGEPPGVSGARGGRPVGGGRTANNPAKKAAPRGPGGNPSTKASESTNDDDESMDQA
jgi:hypothetical protein